MRFLRQRPRQKRPLLLPATQGTDLAVGQILQFHGRQGPVDNFPVMLLKGPPPTQIGITSHFH